MYWVKKDDQAMGMMTGMIAVVAAVERRLVTSLAAKMSDL
jgi:hypothetical protein